MQCRIHDYHIALLFPIILHNLWLDMKSFWHYWRPSDQIFAWHSQILLIDFDITWADKQSAEGSLGLSSIGLSVYLFEEVGGYEVLSNLLCCYWVRKWGGLEDFEKLLKLFENLEIKSWGRRLDETDPIWPTTTGWLYTANSPRHYCTVL